MLNRLRRHKKKQLPETATAEPPNLPIPKPYKDLVLIKLSRAVTYSVLTHVAFVILYVIALTCDILQPRVWLESIFNLLVSFDFLFFFLPFIIIVSLQSVMLSKDYFQTICQDVSQSGKFFPLFCSKITLVTLHVIGSSFAVWLYLCLSEDQYNALYTDCDDNNRCLQEGGLYLILNGAFTGLYFFIHTFLNDRMLTFPVIQQAKFTQFKSRFVSIFKESKWFAIFPTLYFIIFYFLTNTYIYEFYARLFSTRIEYQEFGVELYLFAWLFTTVYIMHMNLFEFFFNLFLTEPIQLPLVKSHEDEITLSEALTCDVVPVIQQLAALDLYLLSMWSSQRRQALYTLSHPGSHPHTWTKLLEAVLTILKDFTDSLNENIESTSNLELTRGASETTETLNMLCNNWNVEKNANVRHMSVSTGNSVEIVEVQRRSMEIRSIMETVGDRLFNVVNDGLEYIKSMFGIKPVHNEGRDVDIQDSLRFGQSIEWLTRGLSNITVASIVEDPYGIIQNDLATIITALFNLKVASERLNKSPPLAKKGTNNNGVKTNNSILSATKRSLTHICRKFRHYLHDIHLRKDIIKHLKNMF